MAGERNSWTSGGSSVDQRGSRYRGFSTRATRAQNSSTGAVSMGMRVGEREQLDVEFAGELAKQMEDAHRATVRQRVWKVRRENGDAPALGRTRAAFEDAMALGNDRSFAL